MTPNAYKQSLKKTLTKKPLNGAIDTILSPYLRDRFYSPISINQKNTSENVFKDLIPTLSSRFSALTAIYLHLKQTEDTDEETRKVMVYILTNATIAMRDSVKLCKQAQYKIDHGFFNRAWQSLEKPFSGRALLLLLLAASSPLIVAGIALATAIQIIYVALYAATLLLFAATILNFCICPISFFIGFILVAQCDSIATVIIGALILADFIIGIVALDFLEKKLITPGVPNILYKISNKLKAYFGDNANHHPKPSGKNNKITKKTLTRIIDLTEERINKINNATPTKDLIEKYGAFSNPSSLIKRTIDITKSHGALCA